MIILKQAVLDRYLFWVAKSPRERVIDNTGKQKLKNWNYSPIKLAFLRTILLLPFKNLSQCRSLKAKSQVNEKISS
jgi:hypothetical protein